MLSILLDAIYTLLNAVDVVSALMKLKVQDYIFKDD